jgi:hypothetical protein
MQCGSVVAEEAAIDEECQATSRHDEVDTRRALATVIACAKPILQ